MIGRGDLLVCDEAAMLDQDTARALLEIVQECDARVAFIGDRHQLPAVGRGGVLDLAAQHAGVEGTAALDLVHRFADPDYAKVSLAMRRGQHVGQWGESVFDVLWRRGQIRLHASDQERTQALAQEAAEAISAGHPGRALMADSREQVAALNGAIRDRLLAEGFVDDSQVVVNESGERLGVGDRVATRRNDWRLGVANRQTWTVTARGDGLLTLRSDHGHVREVPTFHARGWVELAYATTVYGAQGETTAVGHLVIGEHTTAASAYVGMTRGRHDNLAHLVAETPSRHESSGSRRSAVTGPTSASHTPACGPSTTSTATDPTDPPTVGPRLLPRSAPLVSAAEPSGARSSPGTPVPVSRREPRRVPGPASDSDHGRDGHSRGLRPLADRVTSRAPPQDRPGQLASGELFSTSPRASHPGRG